MFYARVSVSLSKLSNLSTNTIVLKISQKSLKSCTYERACILTSEAVIRKCSVKKGVHRNFAKFTGKLLYQSLFLDKVAGFRPVTLLKKRLGTGVSL